MDLDEILKALSEDDKPEDPHCEPPDGTSPGIDPQTLLGLMELFEKLGKADENENFLLALKPLLREKNRGKIDLAIKILKLFSILPELRKSGIFDMLK